MKSLLVLKTHHFMNTKGLFISLLLLVTFTSFGQTYNVPYEIPRFKDFLAECKLQSPQSNTEATDTQIIAGYSSNSFQVADRDKIAFNQTRNAAGTTLRTELRYLTNWYLSEGDRSLYARIKVVEQTCDQVTVLQIHNDTNVGGGSSAPLLRIYKHQAKIPANHLWAAIKTDETGSNTTHVDLGEGSTGYFEIDIRVVSGRLIIDLDGVKKIDMDISFWVFPSYWKAGVYLQDEGEATAYFDQLYTGNGTDITRHSLITSVSGLGSITSNPAGGTYEDGAVVTLTATPNSGSQFDGWSGDISGTSASTTVTMISDKSVTANFSFLPRTVLNIEDFEHAKESVLSYPNPFNFENTIEYELPDDAHVDLTINNVSGKKIKTLIDAFQRAGSKKMEWIPAVDLPNGLYFARLKSKNHIQTIRMVLVR